MTAPNRRHIIAGSIAALGAVGAPALAADNQDRAEWLALWRTVVHTEVLSAADFAATAIPSSINAVNISGYTEAGDGGSATYKRMASEPAHAGKIQSGDGAWWEIASRPIYVEMFGAVGDGATNDRVAIQNAIDTVYALGGGEVLLRAKTYALPAANPTSVSISASTVGLVVPSGVYVRGAGRGATTLKRTASPGYHIVNFAGDIRGAGISDLTIDGSWPSIPGVGHGIHCENGENGVIADLDIHDVTVKNCGSYGIGMQYGSYQRLRLVNIHIQDVGADGIDIKNRNDDNQGVYLDRIYVKEHGRRSDLEGQPGLDIRGECLLSNIFCEYTDVGNANKFGIRLRGGEPGIASGLGAGRSSLVNFTIKASGTQLGGHGLNVSHSNIQIANGFIIGAETGLVVDSNSSDIIVTNVNVRFAVAYGIEARGLRATFYGCNVDSAGTGGFSLQQPQQRVIGGSVTGTTPTGIVIFGGVANVILIGVDLSAPATPVNNQGTNTQGFLCPGWNGTEMKMVTGWQFGTFSNTGADSGKLFDPASGKFILQSSRGPETGTRTHYEFYNPSGLVGSIATDGISTSYNTTSDGELKEALVDADRMDAIAKVKAARPVEFEFRGHPGTKHMGFIAQEMVEVVPDAVTPPSEPGQPWMMDHSKLVPVLWAGNQWLIEQVEALQDQVKELQSQR